MSRKLSLRRDSVQLLPAITAPHCGGGGSRDDTTDATLSGLAVGWWWPGLRINEGRRVTIATIVYGVHITFKRSSV